ncbi:MAG: hypothetical protein OXI49_14460 [Acidobacteriota bacterium]|nr:hypothetical protein [Acidobacteriota bacterium]
MEALVRVDHQRQVGPDRLARPLDDRDVVAPVRVVGAELDGREAHLLQFEQVLGALVGRSKLGGRRVGPELVPAAAQQLVHGLALDLAGDVPQRRFQPGQSDAERLAGVEDAGEALDVEGVAAEDERSQSIADAGVEPAQGHSRRLADDAFVRRHADEGQLVVRLAVAWLRGNVERRRQRRPDVVQLEAFDPQGGGLRKSTVSKSSWFGTLGA